MAMGTALFFIFLAIIFVVALFFIVLNSIFIIIWNVKKHRGKPVKKRWLVIPVVFLIINGILMLFPVGFVIFLRIANSSARPEIVYAPSGKVLYWIEDEMGSIPSFELDEVKYVHIQDARSDDPFVIKYDETQLEEPIANIK
jgi:uncharacterized BrkB/YihY/UPF0761 family membrane protein